VSLGRGRIGKAAPPGGFFGEGTRIDGLFPAAYTAAMTISAAHVRPRRRIVPAGTVGDPA